MRVIELVHPLKTVVITYLTNLNAAVISLNYRRIKTFQLHKYEVSF